MKKLTATMETMIKGAVFHEVRQDGIVARSGYIIAGRSNTVVALIDRGLATTSDAVNLGLNWLTEDGEDMYRGFMNILIDAVDAATGPDLGDDVADDVDAINSMMVIGDMDAPSVEPMSHDGLQAWEIDLLTNERPGDAERAIQADEDAATYAEILAEQDTEEEWVTRLIQELDAYVLTSKHIFVSKSYISTMRRIRAERDARDVQVNAVRADMGPFVVDMFAGLDDLVASGRKTWQVADKAKRRIRAMVRPTMGPKRKPSKARRAR